MPIDTSTPSAAAQSETKQSRVIHMLRAKAGTTLPALMKVTGWQAHSVRGFLSGTVTKKLGLKVKSDKKGDVRTYRIAASSSARQARIRAK